MRQALSSLLAVTGAQRTECRGGKRVACMALDTFKQLPPQDTRNIFVKVPFSLIRLYHCKIRYGGYQPKLPLYRHKLGLPHEVHCVSLPGFVETKTCPQRRQMVFVWEILRSALACRNLETKEKRATSETLAHTKATTKSFSVSSIICLVNEFHSQPEPTIPGATLEAHPEQPVLHGGLSGIIPTS
jgi:hypothetical protein